MHCHLIQRGPEKYMFQGREAFVGSQASTLDGAALWLPSADLLECFCINHEYFASFSQRKVGKDVLESMVMIETGRPTEAITHEMKFIWGAVSFCTVARDMSMDAM
jgi:hypothetical protein